MRLRRLWRLDVTLLATSTLEFEQSRRANVLWIYKLLHISAISDFTCVRLRCLRLKALHFTLSIELAHSLFTKLFLAIPSQDFLHALFLAIKAFIEIRY